MVFIIKGHRIDTTITCVYDDCSHITPPYHHLSCLPISVFVLCACFSLCCVSLLFIIPFSYPYHTHTLISIACVLISALVSPPPPLMFLVSWYGCSSTPGMSLSHSEFTRMRAGRADVFAKRWLLHAGRECLAADLASHGGQRGGEQSSM